MAKSGRTPAPRTCQTWPLARSFIGGLPNPRLFWSSTARKSIAIRLRRHRRARRYTLRIHPTDREAILTMPPRGTLADAKDFAQLHGGWIAARLGRLPKAAPFHSGHRGAAARRSAPDRASRRRARHGVDRNPRQRREDSLRRRRRRAYRPPRPRLPQARSAQGSAEGRRMAYAEELGVRVKRLSIRDQSSRWGSCTSAGSLSFSWRLILAPPYVLDYLAAHEVAHLVEMNHSARFWRVVAQSLRPCRARQDLARHPRQRPASLRDSGLSRRDVPERIRPVLIRRVDRRWSQGSAGPSLPSCD